MDSFFIVVAARFAHVASAAVALGACFALLSIAKLSTYDTLRVALKRTMHAALGLAVLTGLYNYVFVSIPRLREHPMAAYHPVMGVKILVALAFFALLAMQLVPARGLDRDRSRWLTVEAFLGLVVLALGAYLRRLW